MTYSLLSAEVYSLVPGSVKTLNIHENLTRVLKMSSFPYALHSLSAIFSYYC